MTGYHDHPHFEQLTNVDTERRCVKPSQNAIYLLVELQGADN